MLFIVTHTGGSSVARIEIAFQTEYRRIWQNYLGSPTNVAASRLFGVVKPLGNVYGGLVLHIAATCQLPCLWICAQGTIVSEGRRIHLVRLQTLLQYFPISQCLNPSTDCLSTIMMTQCRLLQRPFRSRFVWQWPIWGQFAIRSIDDKKKAGTPIRSAQGITEHQCQAQGGKYNRSAVGKVKLLCG